MLALMVGYGMASVLVRVYWPAEATPDAPQLIAIGLVYSWLGLAMSGPIVLASHRPEPATDQDQDGPVPSPARGEGRTRAELAWLMIGLYWIGLTTLVVPVRMEAATVREAVVLGVVPTLAALGLRLFGPRSGPRRSAWTHRAAVGLLLTWPVAWVGLILLGRTIL